MFPQSFTARVAQRMAIWGAMLGFLLFLYVSTELIRAWQGATIAHERNAATAAALGHVGTPATAAPSEVAVHAARGKDLVAAIEAINGREAAMMVNHRQNKILIVLLTLFVVGQIVVLEYRLLIKPIARMASLLRTSGDVSDLAGYAQRRDEIGAFAKALRNHFDMVGSQQDAARAEQARLSERLAQQEDLRREGVSFQDRIAEVARQLEDHAGRMSSASENLAAISSEADARAAYRRPPPNGCRRTSIRWRLRSAISRRR